MKFFLDNDINEAGIENIKDMINLAPGAKKSIFKKLKQSDQDNSQSHELSNVNDEHPKPGKKSLFQLEDIPKNEVIKEIPDQIQVIKNESNYDENSNNNLNQP